MLKKLLCLILLLTVALSIETVAQTNSKSIDDYPYSDFVNKYLAKNRPGMRPAEVGDYPNKNALELIKKELGKNVQPYRVVEDFNDDGKKDLAIIFISKDKKDREMAVAVFNNIEAKPAEPAYFADRINKGSKDSVVMLHFDKTSKELLLGDYVTMGGSILKPSGNTYTLEELP